MSEPFTLSNPPEPETRPVTITAPGTLDLRLADCMDVMATFPDGHFDLAIVDPPYGIGMDKGAGETKGKGRKKSDFYSPKSWDQERPSPDYFVELQRVSKNQIILGGNYFADLLPASRGWIYWRKLLGGNYSHGELAWTSFDEILREFEAPPSLEPQAKERAA